MSPTEPIATQWTRPTTSDQRDRSVVGAGDLPVDRVRAASCRLADSVDPSRCDIILDVMWSVEVESEVEKWIDSLPVKEFATVLAAVERLSERGSQLRVPASRSLGEGLFELRIDVGRAQRRLTYYFADGRRIVLLTAFRKQRQTERAEIRRARQAMRRCIAEVHTAEEDD